MNKDERIKQIEAEMLEVEKAEIAKLEIKKGYVETHKFKYFKANDGDLNKEIKHAEEDLMRHSFLEEIKTRKDILRRYLKAEDIPDRIDSQLDVLLSKANIVGDSGGNRSSKTCTGTIKAIIKQTGELPDSLKKYEEHFEWYIKRAKSKFIQGRVTAVDNKQLHRVVLKTWKEWTPPEYLKNRKWEDSYSKEFDVLTLYRGKKPCGTVEFLTNSQEVKSSQGGDLDWAHFDEKPDSEKYKETLMRFGTAERLDIQIDWTPTEGLGWDTSLFHDGTIDGEEVNQGIELFKLTTVCNRFVKPATIIQIMDEFEKVSTYEEMKMRLLGEAISLSGLIYGNLFDLRVHVIAPFYEDLKVKAPASLVETQRAEYICLFGCDPHMVTNMAGVFVLVDRMGNCYVDRCYFKNADTEDFKKDFWEIVKENNYRMGWSVADKHSDSTIVAFGGRNIFRELKFSRNGVKGLPALRPSLAYEGSIKAGVDEIKKRLKINPVTKKPSLFIVNRPENKMLIQSFRTLERETYSNEDKKGQKDRISEGKHHLHASLRYIFQFPVNFYPEVINVPELQYMDEEACLI